MNEIERRQIKDALEECAKENENKITPTCYIRIADVCRAGAERIKELEKENDELEKENGQLKTQIEKMKFDVGVTFNTARGYALINKWENGK